MIVAAEELVSKGAGPLVTVVALVFVDMFEVSVVLADKEGIELLLSALFDMWFILESNAPIYVDPWLAM